MLAYIHSEASMEPVLAFIDGAISADSIRSCESHHVDLYSGPALVEVLNFTDMDVEARPVDVALYLEKMRTLVDDVFASMHEVLQEEAEKLSGKEREAVEEWATWLKAWAPMIQQQAVATFCPLELEGVVLVVNGGESQVLVSEGEDVRAVILPCPEGVGSEKAQAHYYVVRQELDDEEDISLYAVKTVQAYEETDPKLLAELLAAEYGMIERDDSRDELKDKLNLAMKQVMSMMSHEILVEFGVKGSSLLAEIEAFV
jgi:hypothetical protein